MIIAPTSTYDPDILSLARYDADLIGVTRFDAGLARHSGRVDLPKVSLLVTGKITTAPNLPGRDLGQYVYQRCPLWRANTLSASGAGLQCRRHTPNNTSSSPAQLVARARFSLGMLAWRDTTAAQRADLSRRASKRGIKAHNLFMKEYMR